MTTTLTTTHRSRVEPDQIDHLGHMNVRFYGVNAYAATAVVLDELLAGESIALQPVDVYTRHHREQLLGAPLVVRSGVWDANERQLRIYHELVNEDTGAIAATFVHRLRCDGPDGRPGAIDDRVVERANERKIVIPPHGATRSISLSTDPVATAPSLAELNDRNLAIRKIRAVTAEECDGSGRYVRANAPMLTWGGESVSNREPEMLVELPNGIRMGWASMETRMTIGRLPSVGDRIQSFSAVIGLHAKTSHRIQWAYDIERGDLLTTFEVVNLAFDTGARAAMSIPDHIRVVEEAAHHPDLAPRPTDLREPT